MTPNICIFIANVYMLYMHISVFLASDYAYMCIFYSASVCGTTITYVRHFVVVILDVIAPSGVFPEVASTHTRHPRSG